MHFGLNNAGDGILGEFEHFSGKEIEDQINLLLCNQIKLTQTVYQKMIEHGQGTIVNIRSMVREYSIPYMSLYNTSEAGLSSFTQRIEY